MVLGLHNLTHKSERQFTLDFRPRRLIDLYTTKLVPATNSQQRPQIIAIEANKVNINIINHGVMCQQFMGHATLGRKKAKFYLSNNIILSSSLNVSLYSTTEPKLYMNRHILAFSMTFTLFQFIFEDDHKHAEYTL